MVYGRQEATTKQRPFYLVYGRQEATTKQTPFYLVYGRQEATLPIQLDIPVQSQHEDGSTEEDQLASRIQSFTGLLRTQGVVKEYIMKAQEMQKMYHDRNNIKPLYPGQLVLVKNTERMNRKVEWSK